MFLAITSVLVLSACGNTSLDKNISSREDLVPQPPVTEIPVLPQLPVTETTQEVYPLGEDGVEVKASIKKVRGEKSTYEATLLLVNHTDDKIDLGGSACRLYLELSQRGGDVWNNENVSCILIYDPLVLEPKSQVKITDEHVDLSEVKRGRYEVVIKMRDVPWIYADAGRIRVR